MLMLFNKTFNKNKILYKTPKLKTIFNWFHSGLISYKTARPIAKYSKRVKNQTIDGRKSIWRRKNDHGFKINAYDIPGHYEINTIYNGDKKGGLLTFNHRYSMKLYAVKIKNRKATSINKTLRKLIKQIGANNIKSITSDNGVEFAYSKVIKISYNLDWYYCDPYKSGQRGQNERLNRDIRKYHLKGCNFHRLSDKTIQNTINKINDYPRRKFNGLSANEMAITVRKNVV